MFYMDLVVEFSNLSFSARERVLNTMIKQFPDMADVIVNSLGMIHLMKSAYDNPDYYKAMRNAVAKKLYSVYIGE